MYFLYQIFFLSLQKIRMSGNTGKTLGRQTLSTSDTGLFSE